MIEADPTALVTPSTSRLHALSIWQVLYSGMGVCICLCGGFVMVLVNLAGILASGGSQTDSNGIYAWTMLLIGMLLLPSLVMGIKRAGGRPIRGWELRHSALFAWIGILIWPLLLFIGSSMIANKGGAAFLPIIQVLGIGLPIWWFFEIGSRGLKTSSSQKRWGILSASLPGTPLLIFIIEMLVLIAAFIVIVIGLIAQPALMSELERITGVLQNPSLSPMVLDNLMSSLFSRPDILIYLLVLMSVIIPLIEELFKPLALWLFAGKQLSPSEGFVSGLISGAGFALLESLLAMGSYGIGGWTEVAIQRSGTALLHITCSGLVGWGLASAWTEKRYLRLALAYFGAVLLHGVWNAMAIFMGVLPFFGSTTDMSQTAPAWIMNAAPIGLIFMACCLLGLLILMNIRLRRANRDKIEPLPQYPIVA